MYQPRDGGEPAVPECVLMETPLYLLYYHSNLDSWSFRLDEGRKKIQKKTAQTPPPGPTPPALKAPLLPRCGARHHSSTRPSPTWPCRWLGAFWSERSWPVRHGWRRWRRRRRRWEERWLEKEKEKKNPLMKNFKLFIFTLWMLSAVGVRSVVHSLFSICW